MDQTIRKILTFLETIEVPFQLSHLTSDTFLPGLKLQQGVLLIDVEKLSYAGDILHEAGHIAVCEPTERHLLSGDVYKSRSNKNWMKGEEIAAIAWSVAAIQHIGLPTSVVLHSGGYKGSSENLIMVFEKNELYGQPLLAAWGMIDSIEDFPALKTWIREVSWADPATV
ncbi:hypothetical protein [Pseudoalteromonas sp. MMG005]|uniref:hypothetical protein n=1 Tax=Pseudoalteromonas sp. MMG005 TaxID=2822682 RepID=UPI001B3A3731|nr:hypothetical protein [Pseudoalteromonas sp. MMG005]MBQ4844052.1 hypothetical protein [Pseudoalteromonas sp. MMG005]